MEVENMSRRSRSPHSRKFPWEESSFAFYKARADLDGHQQGGSHCPGEDPEGHLGHFRGVPYPEVQRRCPHFSDERSLGHQEETFHRRPSPQHDGAVYDQWRASSPHHGGGDGDRRRGGFDFQHFHSRGRSSNDSPRLKREQLQPRAPPDLQHRGVGWKRDLSPSRVSSDQRGRRSTQGLNREDSYRERNHPFRRQRGQRDERFRAQDHYMDQRRSLNPPRTGYGGDAIGSRPCGDTPHSGPLVVEHDHGVTSGRKGFVEHCDADWQRSPRPSSLSQERFRTVQSECARGPRLQDSLRATRHHASSFTSEVKKNSMGYGGQDGPMIHTERGGPVSAGGLFGQGQGGRTEAHRNHPGPQQSSKGYQGPQEELRLDSSRSLRGEGKPGWAREARPQWRDARPGSPGPDVHPPVPCEKVRGWTEQKNSMVEMGETLTIKVDTSQPLNQNSAQSSPSDRQLSLDLVNVGRQRLDFLPMLEHSGMRHKSPGHTGTFAQEIITLVHRVKEQYFSGGGITMNERFSSLPTPVFSEAEVTELTLDQRFSSTRGFSVEADALLDEDEPLFSRPGSLQANDGDFKMGEEQRVSRWSSVSDGMQPVRGPGDLRHDLERKRQQRLEGVKVTISGTSQRPLAPHSVSAPEGLSDQLGLMGAHGSSSWGRQGSMGTQKGTGFQRRNSRFSNQLGPMRRKNPHNNPAGSHW